MKSWKTDSGEELGEFLKANTGPILISGPQWRNQKKKRKKKTCVKKDAVSEEDDVTKTATTATTTTTTETTTTEGNDAIRVIF
uniref:Uncharacterized protein n=1 Tax=Parascaris univalens TaxID=6257 RepID=A0A915AY90_PARUN